MSRAQITCCREVIVIQFEMKRFVTGVRVGYPRDVRSSGLFFPTSDLRSIGFFFPPGSFRLKLFSLMQRQCWFFSRPAIAEVFFLDVMVVVVVCFFTRLGYLSNRNLTQTMNQMDDASAPKRRNEDSGSDEEPLEPRKRYCRRLFDEPRQQALSRERIQQQLDSDGSDTGNSSDADGDDDHRQRHPQQRQWHQQQQQQQQQQQLFSYSEFAALVPPTAVDMNRSFAERMGPMYKEVMSHVVHYQFQAPHGTEQQWRRLAARLIEERTTHCSADDEGTSAAAIERFMRGPEQFPCFRAANTSWTQVVTQMETHSLANRQLFMLTQCAFGHEFFADSDNMHELRRRLKHIDKASRRLAAFASALHQMLFPAALPDRLTANQFVFGLCEFGLANERKLKRVQTILVFVKLEMVKFGLRKNGEQLYCEVRTVDGKRTGAWEPFKHATMSEFLEYVTGVDYSAEHYYNMTAELQGKQGIIKQLTAEHDAMTPVLEMDRQVWSFKNGQFHSVRDEFHPYADRAEMPYTSCKYIDVALADTEPVGPDYLVDPVTGCCYACTAIFDAGGDDRDVERRGELLYDPSHDTVMTAQRTRPTRSWMEIRTHYMDKIMTDQRWPRDVQKAFWFCLGRLTSSMRPSKGGDNLQFVPYLFGAAGTGKSTIFLVVHAWYGPDKICTFNNNMEKMFGFESLLDKWVWLAPETKSDFNMAPTEFQKIVSGETLAVARKNKGVRNVDIDAPGMIGGNEVMKWQDKANSILRRHVVFPFQHTPAATDTMLLAKLKQELPNIIRKATRAYHFGKLVIGDRGIVDALPSFFKQHKEEIAEVMNTTKQFLKDSTQVLFAKEYMTSKTELMNALRKYCSDQKMPEVQWTSVRPQLAELGIVELTLKDQQRFNRRTYPCGELMLMGVASTAAAEQFEMNKMPQQGAAGLRSYVASPSTM